MEKFVQLARTTGHTLSLIEWFILMFHRSVFPHAGVITNILNFL